MSTGGTGEQGNRGSKAETNLYVYKFGEHGGEQGNRGIGVAREKPTFRFIN